ncbi:hypothetical protein [Chromobacterium sp. IIBBL 290-4]|uniref:hypothetical protein n=1 Tax=Chromobacterium sp. IIBBL 290-4 TaxID=2953890 RepID=UPI0020B6AC30|nr:hypothetical protein [Chromobacterium sp. IIBBL 290-4]UTH76715.1 hypothetical protein NKT35_11700 [Chromobacterium sp. IIBBL 290-4]
MAQLIDALEPLAVQLLKLAGERDRVAFAKLYEQHEGYTHQLLGRLEAGENKKLSATQREALKRVLGLRSQIEQQIALWAEQLKNDLLSLNQSSKLMREYKG